MSEYWKPTALREAIKQRAQLCALIREFMSDRGILEVQTPVLSHKAATDPNLHSFETSLSSPRETNKQRLFLNTSPEFSMKRLLASGSGPIYQMTPVFRNEEESRLHQPEFTLLEWYRPGYNEMDLINEVKCLLELLDVKNSKKMAYADIFQAQTGLNPHQSNTEKLADFAEQLGLRASLLSHNDYLDFIFTEVILPKLGDAPCFIYDFPKTQAALAKIEGGRAKRFELIIKGIEIANGFYELNDAKEQYCRFESDNKKRKINNREQMPIDHLLLDALTVMPDCAGVAIGIDRLLMVLHDYTDIKQVISFPIDRC